MPSARLARTFVAIIFLLGFAAVGRAQQQPLNPIPAPRNTSPRSSFPDPAANSDPNLDSIQQRQAVARNDERQKKLVADTDKLFALAAKLQADVAKTDKNTLSLDVIRRAEEIEKLARTIKERMKG